jgi:lysophospholipase L1-like esterase
MNIKIMTDKRTHIISLLIIWSIPLMAQDTIAYKPNTHFPFIRYDSNYIHNQYYLYPFYEKLLVAKQEKNSVVNILHVGDSHIQADYLTHTTRTLFQQTFGNAGLGLTFPGRAARTHESQQIYSATKGEWDSNKITLSQTQAKNGISGANLKTYDAGSTINLKTQSYNYSFNRITLFLQKDFSNYQITIKDSTGQTLAIAGAFTNEAYKNVSKILLPYEVNQIELETSQTLPSQHEFTFYGVSFENSKPGIRYHISGINGARFRHYTVSEELINQVSALYPDLIIISLGTNEAFDHPNLDPKVSSQITELITALKRANPNTIIMLTTPADFFKHKTRRNPGVKIVQNKIIETANQNHLPYWDLYEVGGGNHSADRWKKKDLLQADGIHFTKKGYELQGELLYEALIKGYNEYVRYRSSKTP